MHTLPKLPPCRADDCRAYAALARAANALPARGLRAAFAPSFLEDVTQLSRADHVAGIGRTGIADIQAKGQLI